MQKIEELKKVLPAISNSVQNLHKESAKSLCGPCPKCWGDDRFVYRTDTQKFWCRQCYEKGGDVINFHAWIENTDVEGLMKKYLPDEDKPFCHYQLGEPTEKYPYTDAKGKVLSYNCRFEPKAFRQCSADGLKWKVTDIKKVPYQLPKVVEAESIFIVEGEKDVHSLAKLNLVGTCNAGGAGNWTEDLNPYFKDREICLIPDNDVPGRKHIAKVYENLKDIAASIKLIELPGLPEKGDFTDWLNTYDDLDEAGERFSIMVDGGGPYEPEQVEDILSFEFTHSSEILKILKPIQWRIKDIMEDNVFYYGFGDAGNFKTFVEIDRLLHIAAGVDYYGHKVKQGTVFYIAGEGQQGIGRRIAAWLIHQKISADVPFFVSKTPTQLMDKGALDEVRRAVDHLSAQYGPPAIIHIDTLARNFGEGDENATKDMNRVISNIDTAFGTNIGRGLTHHTGHTNKDRARGSYALHGAADAAFRIQLNQDNTVLVTCVKMKDAPMAPAMLFDTFKILLRIGDQNDSSFVLDLNAEGPEALKGDSKLYKAEVVVAALKIMGGQVDGQVYLKGAVMNDLECGEATARRAIEAAVEMGKIICKPGKGRSYSYVLPE